MNGQYRIPARSAALEKSAAARCAVANEQIALPDYHLVTGAKILKIRFPEKIRSRVHTGTRSAGGSYSEAMRPRAIPRCFQKMITIMLQRLRLVAVSKDLLRIEVGLPTFIDNAQKIQITKSQAANGSLIARPFLEGALETLCYRRILRR